MTPQDLPGRMSKHVRVEDGHWLWTGAIQTGGYGSVRDPQRKRANVAHRLSYEALVGPIPDGLTIDHLCRVPACINPDHLEAVTLAENVRRANAAKTTCRNGHPWIPENKTVKKHEDGYSYHICIICKREQDRASRARRMAPLGNDAQRAGSRLVKVYEISN